MEMGPKNCRCKAYQDNKINALLMTSYTGGISAWMIIEHDALCLYLSHLFLQEQTISMSIVTNLDGIE